MYQGENAKFEIELKDHMGNTISADINTKIEILIYRESDKKVYLTYKYPAIAGTGAIDFTAGTKLFSFIVKGTDTETMPLGSYIFKVKSITTDSAFGAEGLVNIEEAPIFTIKSTVKNVQQTS